MIGAIVYVLRAENSATMPFVNGRLMHAAFFQILNAKDPELGSFVHNKMNIKPFTVSFLDPDKEVTPGDDNFSVQRGDKLFWRVTCLNKDVLLAAMTVPVGETIRAGKLVMSIEKIFTDERLCPDTGIVAVDDFISDIRNLPPVREIIFDFVSPVTFRIDDFDAPYPRAELVFASLADKWTQAGIPAGVDKKLAREFAAKIWLTEWHGMSKKISFGPDRSTLAFWGKFYYNVASLKDSVRNGFVMLARLSYFTGVGRLTSQGFGQTRVEFR